MIELLTDTRREVLATIAGYTRSHGYPPSLREVAASTGLSTTTTDYHLRRLANGGYVRRDYGRSRSLVLTDLGSAVAL
ncbi:LexA family protein [Longispora fulva]|uniref:Repressor LexA n=1 Tax=Longispora fulva TaxID=619741 RepID=A0A8J7GNX8_9ACTN|nr:helix-turn-helix domain-containing protein [Longispora fulva]MBG6140662.1 repressor LexA [Longispora fulva]